MNILIKMTFVAVYCVLIAACGTHNEQVNQQQQILKISIGASPQSIDPHVVTGVPGIKVLGSLGESLVKINTKTFDVEPAGATHWEISEDGLKYTFYLRPEARWSNGEIVTAQDYVYTWQRALAPAIGWQYANDYYSLKGAKDYNQGKIQDFSTVGVKAINDFTLRFTLASPDALFLQKMRAENKAPVHQKTLEKYGAVNDVTNPWTRAGNFVGNGPFQLEKWEINKILVVKKNPYYWDADKVKLDEIHFYPIETESAEERAFRSGQIHVAHGGRVPTEKIPKYKTEEPEKLVIIQSYATYFYLFNTQKPPFDNPDVRKALSLAVDRQAIVDNITKAGETAATTLSPMFGSYQFDFGQDIYAPEKAVALLTKAGYPNGEGFPTSKLIYNTADAHKKVALAIQEMWKKTLNVDVTLENQEWKIFLDNRQQLAYDIARAGSFSDIADPQDFLESYTTGHGMNDSGWSNLEFDALTQQAKQQTETNKRFELLSKAERILLDQAPLIPLYYYSSSYLIDPKVKNFDFNAIDRINYKDIYIDYSGTN